MEEILIPGGDARRARGLILAQFGPPAFVRRAREVQDAFDDLLASCRRKRAEMLDMVRILVGRLFALAGGPDRLRPLLADDTQVELLRRLHEETAPQLRDPVEPTRSPRTLRMALLELCASIERFNWRWLAYLPAVNLARLNNLREGYNRHYILEKECVLGSARLARDGFRRLDPLTPEDLAAAFPPLVVPQLKEALR